jgi:hypothetical protein
MRRRLGRSGPRRRPNGTCKSTIPVSWSSWTAFASAGSAAPRGPSGRTPPKVAADLAARGWRLERVMSDNASEFRATVFGQAVAELGARHRFIRAGRPQTNGCVERVQQTILDECWKPASARYLIPKQTGLKLDRERYLRYYNTERAHTGRWTRGRTPEEILGKAKLWHKKR